MLDQDTKRRIDTARDILVGKVPDPKSQVEQITIALIYKFMDDIDKASEELGGEAQFFTDGFKQYSWSKLMDSKLGGQERLNLYTEGISKLSTNKNLPQLFRDIFKGAFLPYRDPNVLHIFLKEINGFAYDHSENLGNAFEYLLSIMGSQGDAGQFRTSRHIIDFIVDVVNPKKDETVLDPACGTAGFLISAYKHILKQHDGKDDPENKEKPLTPDEREKLMEHFVGYDISPDMVRLSLVNMYLHGFQGPKIFEYDTLGSEDRWDERYDVILANPPFMTPKGGVRPHRRFSIQANKAEVLFVDYILEHLTSEGRAGIIIPEGIVFINDTPYKNLRKMLVEEAGLYAVVSLPAGVFNPYSNVKTSILFLDKKIGKLYSEILFLKIGSDGFDLGAQRRKIENNDLPKALEIITAWKSGISPNSNLALLVKKDRVAENGNYRLSGDFYKESTEMIHHAWPMVELGDVLDYEQPTKYIVDSVDYNDEFAIPVLTAGKTFILGRTNETEGIFKEKLPVIIFDDFTTATKYVDFPFKVKSSAMKILHADKNKIDIRFAFYSIQKIVFPINEHKRYWISEYSNIKIPLPPLDIPKKIIDEIEVKQRAINSAKELIRSLERERDAILDARLQNSKGSNG
jgi:type I restriction enzyme M protein